MPRAHALLAVLALGAALTARGEAPITDWQDGLVTFYGGRGERDSSRACLLGVAWGARWRNCAVTSRSRAT